MKTSRTPDRNFKSVAAGLCLLFAVLVITPVRSEPMEIINGWISHQGKGVFGYGQISSLWRWRKPNITRNDPGGTGPNRTEDLEKLTDNMLTYGYPALEHNIGLWYDRRRDEHLVRCRINDKVKPPFLEQPWARTEQGVSCDGLPKYDLTRFNSWYFDRLRKFAALSDRKGVILYHNYYNQHALLEVQPHYVDYAWRPGNAIQDTHMPDKIPAANQFYDVSNDERRRLHKIYIRKVLDEIGQFENVFHFTSGEYTGNAEFVRFWMDTIVEWENEAKDRDVRIGLSAPLDVIEDILSDPQRSVHIDAVDMRFFWYKKNGILHAIRGGREIPGRKYDGDQIALDSAPEQIYRQTLLYRDRFPDKVIFHALGLNRRFWLSFLMAGGSISFADIYYLDSGRVRPKDYIEPESLSHMQNTLAFLRTEASHLIPHMTPAQELESMPDNVYVLQSSSAALVYSLRGDSFDISHLNLKGRFTGMWFDPNGDTSQPVKTEDLFVTQQNQLLSPPSDKDWLFLIKPPD